MEGQSVEGQSVEGQSVEGQSVEGQSGPGHSEDTGCVTLWQSVSQDLDTMKTQAVSHCGSQALSTGHCEDTAKAGVGVR